MDIDVHLQKKRNNMFLTPKPQVFQFYPISIFNTDGRTTMFLRSAAIKVNNIFEEEKL